MEHGEILDFTPELLAYLDRQIDRQLARQIEDKLNEEEES